LYNGLFCIYTRKACIYTSWRIVYIQEKRHHYTRHETDIGRHIFFSCIYTSWRMLLWCFPKYASNDLFGCMLIGCMYTSLFLYRSFSLYISLFSYIGLFPCILVSFHASWRMLIGCIRHWMLTYWMHIHWTHIHCRSLV